jgi:hypothetical protein
MSSQAQYASIPHIGVGVVATGDTSRTSPASVSHVFTAGANGSRIDRLNLTAIAATIASTVRLFLVNGSAGQTINSISFSGTTATVTTAQPHGLLNGNLVTVRGALPSAYNVVATAVTVTGANSFTYTMASAPTANATSTGWYVSTLALPTYNLWQEVPVAAVTPSGTTQVFSADLSVAAPAPQTSRWPLVLPAGWMLWASVNDTQPSSGISLLASGGDF